MQKIGKTKIEKALLERFDFIEKVINDGILRGYRLYNKGCFGLPSFSRYYWLKGHKIKFRKQFHEPCVCGGYFTSKSHVAKKN